MTIKLRGKINFPATVTATGGLQVVKANGIWTVSPNFAGLTSIAASAVSDPTTQQVWIYNPAAGSYAVLTLAGLGDALFKLTSTTSLLIGTGSKVFATQTGKDVGVGQYVLVASDAAPSTNFMFGQITAYASGSLTVNVTNTGGSGTLADWTIRVAGAVGVTGATGASPGIRQAYSTTTADADPGAGVFRLNNATPASATAAYLDNLDSAGATVSTILDLYDDSTTTTRGFIRFEKSGDPTIWAQFAVTGSVVDGTGYRKLTLASGAGSGAFTATDVFAITFFRTGDAGSGTIAGATNHGVGLATGASSMSSTAVMTDGQLLVGQSAADPLPKTITGDVTFTAAGATVIGALKVLGSMIAAATIDLTAKVTGILPTANGGTGIAFFTAAGPTVARVYTFPDQADTIVTQARSNVFTKQQTATIQTLTDAASIAWDCSLGQKARVTLAGNRTMAAVTNAVEGTSYYLWAVQDATGTRTLAYTTSGAGSFDFGASGTPVLTTTVSLADLLCFEAVSIGGTLKLRFMGIRKAFT